MIRENRLDVLLVAGPDYSHCDRILAGLRHNLRVVAGKPVVINCEEVRRILGRFGDCCGRSDLALGARWKAVSNPRLAGRLLSFLTFKAGTRQISPF